MKKLIMLIIVFVLLYMFSIRNRYVSSINEDVDILCNKNIQLTITRLEALRKLVIEIEETMSYEEKTKYLMGFVKIIPHCEFLTNSNRDVNNCKIVQMSNKSDVVFGGFVVDFETSTVRLNLSTYGDDRDLLKNRPEIFVKPTISELAKMDDSFKQLWHQNPLDW